MEKAPAGVSSASAFSLISLYAQGSNTLRHKVREVAESMGEKIFKIVNNGVFEALCFSLLTRATAQLDCDQRDGDAAAQMRLTGQLERSGLTSAYVDSVRLKEIGESCTR
jgi:hypothetical protein